MTKIPEDKVLNRRDQLWNLCTDIIWRGTIGSKMEELSSKGGKDFRWAKYDESVIIILNHALKTTKDI
jgi:hypothetical protein